MLTYREFWQPLTAVYAEGEARAVAQLVLEQRFGLSLADVLCGRMLGEAELTAIQQRLLTGEPVQYVLGEAEFGGRLFSVAPGVLIPRPETLELCRWVIGEYAGQQGCSVLDVGTGSGCIACTLAADMVSARVEAWDISERALAIARENAGRHHVDVTFRQVDVLAQSPLPAPDAFYDVIVSNPPYVCECEKQQMSRGVLDYEPHLALFVPDDRPLLFYSAIGDYARGALRPGGALYFEINPLYVRQLEIQLRSKGFVGVESRDDQFGKARFTKAIQP